MPENKKMRVNYIMLIEIYDNYFKSYKCDIFN